MGRRGTPIVTPELKSYDSADIEDLERWVPEGSEVIYWMTLTIGLPGSQAADNFQVCVATPPGLHSPDGLRTRPKGGDQPPAIVVQSYSWAAVVSEIERRLVACTGRDWSEVCEKLRHQFAWEYEGMR